MNLIIGTDLITPVAVQPFTGGIIATLKGPGLMAILDAAFQGSGVIEVSGGELDRRRVEVTAIDMQGATTQVTLTAAGPRHPVN